MEKYELIIRVSTSVREDNSAETSWSFDIESENLKEAIDKSAEQLKKLVYGVKKCSMELCIKD